MTPDQMKEEIQRQCGVNVRLCMRCGKCTATCPSYDEMEYHPHQFVYMIEQGDIAPLLSSPSLYHCLSCMACIERCPRQVAPGKLIEEVRFVVERMKGGGHMVPDDLRGKVDEDLPQQAVVSAMRKYNK